MMADSETTSQQADLKQMPTDELAVLAGDLMIRVPTPPEREGLIDAIRKRLTLLDRIDRDGLLGLVIQGHRPVAKSADKLTLVREIAQVDYFDYNELDHASLLALAQLRNISVPHDANDRQIRTLLLNADGISGWFTRQRRRLVGKLLGDLLDSSGKPREYQFLPEKKTDKSLRRQIEQRGVMSGLASTIKGAADEYLDAKLEEIEERIDRKLDEIDQRLAEWRDREIVNRLRIIKLTLLASAIIAAISLVYSWLKPG